VVASGQEKKDPFAEPVIVLKLRDKYWHNLDFENEEEPQRYSLMRPKKVRKRPSLELHTCPHTLNNVQISITGSRSHYRLFEGSDNFQLKLAQSVKHAEIVWLENLRLCRPWWAFRGIRWT
jgi:hypothetical protein